MHGEGPACFLAVVALTRDLSYHYQTNKGSRRRCLRRPQPTKTNSLIRKAHVSSWGGRPRGEEEKRLTSTFVSYSTATTRAPGAEKSSHSTSHRDLLLLLLLPLPRPSTPTTKKQTASLPLSLSLPLSVALTHAQARGLTIAPSTRDKRNVATSTSWASLLVVFCNRLRWWLALVLVLVLLPQELPRPCTTQRPGSSKSSRERARDRETATRKNPKEG